MKHLNPHADVWVIHQDQACLLQHDPSAPTGWQQNMSMPLQEFLGSAIALSSFTQADTRVFYNLTPGNAGQDSNAHSHSAEQHWLGIHEDPLRLLQAVPGRAQQDIKALRSMGKTPEVVSCAEAVQFERATPMMRVSPCEKKHLEKWLAARREGSGMHKTSLGLLKNLWIKADPAYQTLRIVAVCCTVLTLAIAHYLSEYQTRRQLDDFAQQVREALKSGQENSANSVSSAWPEWGLQLGKFGREKRANLNAVQIQWNEDGHVHTQANLNRDRKRVPKGCTLETPQRASCSTKGLTR